MSEKKLSLFELHFHDRVQFGPRTIDGLGNHDEEAAEDVATSLTDDASAAGEDRTDETATGGGGVSVVRPLVGLGVLAAAAYVVRKLLGGEAKGLDALDDIETGTEEPESEDTDIDEAVSIEVTSGEDATSGRKGLAAAAVVAVLVVLALVARKLLDDAVEAIEVPEDFDEE